jgi:probable selenate reductase FAD-binding subunit
MIVEYHRPKTIEEAVRLLGRDEPKTVPMGGGTVLNAVKEKDFAVVDLQDLNLDQIETVGNQIKFGAAVTLESLIRYEGVPDALIKATRLEAGKNIRQAATIAGALIASDGRSPFATVMLALDAELHLLPEEENIRLGDLLPLRRELLKGKLVKDIFMPNNVRIAFEYVARSSADQPIVSASVARWKSGRTRIVLGGYGSQPIMVLDGAGDLQIEEPVRMAFSDAEDEWASAEYRSDIAVVLVKRCLDQIGE